MATLQIAYHTQERQCWLLKLSFLGRPFILAYQRCIALKKAMKSKLARAGSQTASAETMYIQKTKVQEATVESRTIGNWNCLKCFLRFTKPEDFGEDTIESITEFEVPKRRKWPIFNKKHTEVHGQKKVKKELLRRDFIMEELEAEIASSRFEARGQKEVLRKDFNMEEFEAEMTSLGYGGLNEQFKDAILKLVVPRSLPRALSREIRLQPIKGLIIHGPPGTGKTLVARRLSEILNAKLKVVRGPEIIGTLVGSGEKNLRDVFAPSIKDFEQMGEESPVHVIIFEEIDAIAGKRGANSATDRIVSQLSTLVDGVRRQTNLLLVGTTSRIELIDDGLLRPGRFELRLRIDLPDEDERLKILQINSKRMQRRVFFDTDIDLSAVASATQGFTRVDLEGLLQTAFENALFRGFQGRMFKLEGIQIKKVDIQMALKNFGKESLVKTFE
ncbi:vesicle-fusing ATPase-like [Lycium barbarum]|uniref:vesicle-fusing ATPase-like n=1 Tax=Lycium barbarum TaxID=112863 RepID=UPI00293F2BD9|nr:vesicle-fusing ATPase-like [Lycium barbarum]XP_060193825.1 vesicle-fusing ATPase-like [Lycium barbarum]